MACLINPISQPSLDISLIWIPLSGMRLPTHREDQYDMTDPSWVFTRFQSWCSVFNGRKSIVSQRKILQLILCIGFHGSGLLAMFFG
jgi:hypothetical protein